MNLTNLMRASRVEQDAFGTGRLAGIGVRSDADVARML